MSARLSLETKGKSTYSAKVSEDHKVGLERTFLTQNQLHELLDSDQARQLVEGAEERGYLEAAELEAFALEHELNEQEIEDLTRELERIGLEIRTPEAIDRELEREAERAAQVEAQNHVLSGAADSLQ